MEPLVKSEPCEDLYSDNVNQNVCGMPHNALLLQPRNNLKRFYQEMEANSSPEVNMNYPQTNTFYQAAKEVINSSLQLAQDNNFPIQHNTMNEHNQTYSSKEVQPLKRKKLEESVLFNPPFYKLVEEITSPSNKDAIAARCYSCGKIVKGNRGISSNFIKHMKRSHPEVNKMYEMFKAQKSKIGHLPNRTQMLRDIPAVNENGDNNSFLIMETKGAYESSEDNDEDSLITNKEISETNENSKESQHFQTINPQNTTIELSTKTLEAIGNIIDEKLKHFVKQKDYDHLNEKVETLPKLSTTNSLPSTNSSIAELKTEVDNLKKECSVLRLAVQKSQAGRRQLQNELQTVDKLLHQRKLIIRNIIVHDVENPLKSVEKLFRERLNLQDIKIINCSIIPATENCSAKESTKETLTVEMANPQDCKLILRHVHKLKNTGIFIETEISKFQRQRKNKLMVLRKELLKRKPDLKVLVRDITLIVNGKKFYWDDVEGLCHDGKEEDALEINGVEYLNVISGLDLREFVNILQNYNVQIT